METANIDKLTSAANDGDEEAAFNLAVHYFNIKDNEKAFRWLKHVSNNFRLNKDYEKAIPMLKRAATPDLDYINAQYLLGLCYLDGLGVEQNSEYALTYIAYAAGGGHEDAQLFIDNNKNKELQIFFKYFPDARPHQEYLSGKLDFLQFSRSSPKFLISLGTDQEGLEEFYQELKSFYVKYELDWSEPLEDICKDLNRIIENAAAESEAEEALTLLDECEKLMKEFLIV